MSGIHVKGLLVGHFRQVLHGKQVLCPVLKYGAISAISDQLFRVLSDGRIEIVLYHEHDRCRLSAFSRVVIDRSGEHCVIRFEPVHVDPSIGLQLIEEFRSKLFMPGGRKVAQCILKGQFFLRRSQDVLSPRGPVDSFRRLFFSRYFSGDSLGYRFLEFYSFG